MKRRHAVVLAALIAAASPSVRSWAKDKDAKKAGSRSDRFLEMMQDKLDLTDAQVEKLKPLLDEQKAKREKNGPQMKETVAKLRKQLRNKASDADLQATLDQLSAARKAMQADREQMMEKMSAILTPAQRAKAAVAMAGRFEMMRGRMHHKMQCSSGECGKKGRHHKDADDDDDEADDSGSGE